VGNLTKTLWKYWISPHALVLISEEVSVKYPRETGGILVGWQQDWIFHIETAIGPGPDAIHTRNSFKRDGNFSQTILDNIVYDTHGQWDYLGEWHSHPQKMGPSYTDINSLQKVQASHEFNILQPLLGVIINEKKVWHFHCYLLLHKGQLIEIPQQDDKENYLANKEIGSIRRTT
jgi:integrative and conjugative element protein (TIGR02256 family)